MNQRLAALVLVVTAIVGAAACGVQDDSSPRAMKPEDVPFDLLAPESTATTLEQGEGVGSTVWFVDNEGFLARSRREIAPPVTIEAVLNELLAGVTDAEANNGLRTNIPAGTMLNDVDGPTDRLVTVDLSEEFLNVSREVQRLALAQVVFTATALPEVNRVLFQFAGRPVEVPGAGEELTSAPLTRADFSQFDPTATTTAIRP